MKKINENTNKSKFMSITVLKSNIITIKDIKSVSINLEDLTYESLLN